MIRMLLAAAIAVASTTSAMADRVSKTVPKNKKTFVGGAATYSEGMCDPMSIPQMRIRKKPSHGKVEFRTEYFKLSERAGSCAGKRVKGTAVFYTPNRGYRGNDKFSVSFTMMRYTEGSRMKHITDTYDITVK